MEYKNLTLKKQKTNQTIIFVIAVAILGIIGVVSVGVAVSEERIVLKKKTFDTYILAQDEFEKGEYAKAIQMLQQERAISVDPKRQYEVSLLLARAYIEVNESQRAITLLSLISNSIYADMASINYYIGKANMKQGFSDDALIAFEKALIANPKHVQTLLTLGTFYMESNLPRLAKGYYERVLSVEENNDEAKLNIGVIALGEGFRSLAYDILSDLVRSSKNVYSERAAAILGDMYVGAGDTDSAIQMYLKSLSSNSVQPDSVKMLVSIYEQNEDYEGIKKVYEQVIEQNPNDPIALLTLGNLYADEEQYDRAIPYYLRLTRMKESTNTYNALSLLANAYYMESMLKEASDTYKKIIVNKQNDDIYIQALERLGDITYRQKAYHLSIRYYQEFFGVETNNSIFMPRLGELEIYYGNTNRGLFLLESSIEADIGKAFPIRTLATYYESLGRNQDAIAYYTKALEKYPNDRESVFRLGMLYYKLKEYDKAKQQLLIAANDIDNALATRESAWSTLATMSEEIRVYNDATTYYRHLVLLSPTVDNYSLYASFLYRRLNYSQAIEAYLSALEQAPPKNRLAEIYLGLAKSYFRLDYLDAAEDAYKKVLEYDRGNLQAQEGLKQTRAKKTLF